MQNGLFSMWSHDLLIELSETLLVVSVFGASEKFEIEPYIAIKNDGKHKVVEQIGREAKGLASHDVDVSNPFSHPRLLIANFEKAEKVLQFAVAQTSAQKWLKPSPRIVMHQLEKNEGGLTDIEIKVLRELALGAGARVVKVHQGHRLSAETSRFDDVDG